MTAPLDEKGRWFDLMIGDSRLGACATEGCGGQPTKRLEAGGVGSNYCSGCAAKIEALSAVALPDELEGSGLVNDLRSASRKVTALKEYTTLAGAAKTTLHRLAETSARAADALSQAHSTIAALRAERDEAVDRAKVWEHYWQHEVKVKGEVISWCKDYQAKLETAEAEVKRLTEEKEALREALEELVDTLTPAEHASGRDPAYGDRVRAIGAEIGFGALMSCASTEWRLWLEENGYPVGSEFVSGPCRAVLQSDLRVARAALNSREKAE